MPSIHVFNWKLFFKVHDYVLLGSFPKIHAENGIPKKSLVASLDSPPGRQ